MKSIKGKTTSMTKGVDREAKNAWMLSSRVDRGFDLG
jgi:hypothetical protein